MTVKDVKEIIDNQWLDDDIKLLVLLKKISQDSKCVSLIKQFVRDEDN